MDTGRHLSGLHTLVLTSQHLFSIKYAYLRTHSMRKQL